MKKKIKILLWVLKDFSILSSLKILLFLFKKFLRKNDPKKRIKIKFKFKENKIQAMIRENDDLFILSDIFMLEEYALPKIKDEIKTILDCGAHIGAVSVYLGIKYPQAKIFCFEPNQESLKNLKDNLSLNNINAKIFPLAISRRKETLNFDADSEYSAASRINKEGKIKVNVINLKEVMSSEKISSIDLLKLDIEGEEINALIGLGDKIKKVKNIVCENHYEMYNPKELFNILTKNDFIIDEKTRKLNSPIIIAYKK